MNLAEEVELITKDAPDDISFFEESDLVKDYQSLLEKGLIKKRGYMLQTIEEKQRDALEVKIIYSTRHQKAY